MLYFTPLAAQLSCAQTWSATSLTPLSVEVNNIGIGTVGRLWQRALSADTASKFPWSISDWASMGHGWKRWSVEAPTCHAQDPNNLQPTVYCQTLQDHMYTSQRSCNWVSTAKNNMRFHGEQCYSLQLSVVLMLWLISVYCIMPGSGSVVCCVCFVFSKIQTSLLGQIVVFVNKCNFLWWFIFPTISTKINVLIHSS